MYGRSTAPHAPCRPLNNIPSNYQPVCYSVPWQFSMAPYTCSLCNSRKPRPVYSQPRPYTHHAPLLITPRVPRPGMVISALTAWHGSVTIPYKQVLRGIHALCTELAVLTAGRWPQNAVRTRRPFPQDPASSTRGRHPSALPHLQHTQQHVIATPLGIVVNT